MTRTHKNVTALAVAKRLGLDEAEVSSCMGPGGSAELVQQALRAIDGRWKLPILFHLFASPVLRFSELQQAIGKVSHRMLTLHLRALQRDGIVQRTVYETVPPRVEYQLTQLGRELRPVLLLLRDWSKHSGGGK